MCMHPSHNATSVRSASILTQYLTRRQPFLRVNDVFTALTYGAADANRFRIRHAPDSATGFYFKLKADDLRLVLCVM